MERLAALEAEVKADADAQRARKAVALTKLRDQRVTQTAGGALVVRNRAAPAEQARPRSRRTDRADAELDDDDRRRVDSLEDLGGALELASKANRVKQELARKPRKGEKNWMISGGASLLGPIGWLYAGSLREAVPATAAWLLVVRLEDPAVPVDAAADGGHAAVGDRRRGLCALVQPRRPAAATVQRQEGQESAPAGGRTRTATGQAARRRLIAGGTFTRF
jgi:hypothetical protein